MHRIDLTPVYVLHTRPFRSTSLIVELFSKNYGRVAVVARSARGPQSRYHGQLQLFTPMLASWSGLHELKMLGTIELNGMPLQLNQNPLFCGFYFNELLMRLLHKEDPHPALFDLYHDCLCQLEKNVSGSGSGKKNIAVTLRRFEKKLLDDLGYGLPLTFDAKTREKIQANAYYQFIPNQGFFLCDSMQDSQTYFLGADLINIATEKFDAEPVLIAAKKLMRYSLAFLLGNKPLNSRELF